jgi:hypothetical protein
MMAVAAVLQNVPQLINNLRGARSVHRFPYQILKRKILDSVDSPVYGIFATSIMPFRRNVSVPASELRKGDIIEYKGKRYEITAVQQ